MKCDLKFNILVRTLFESRISVSASGIVVKILEYETLLGFCAGKIDSYVERRLFSGVEKGSMSERDVSAITGYFLYIDFERDLFEFMEKLFDVLLEVNKKRYWFDEENCLINYQYYLEEENI